MYDPKPKVLTKVTVFIRLQGVSNSVFLTHAKLSCQSQQIFKVKASFLQNLFSPTTLVWKDFKSEKKLGGHSKGTDSWRKKKNEWHNLIQSNGDQKSCLKVQKTSLKMSRKIIKLKEKKNTLWSTQKSIRTLSLSSHSYWEWSLSIPPSWSSPASMLLL